MRELMESLLLWTVALTGYEQPGKLPVIEAVSQQHLIQTLCGNQHCTALAYYDTDTQTIYYDERMRLEHNQSARSYIVHEMVHYLQDLNGELLPAMHCEERIDKEREAYRIQQHFLHEHQQPASQIEMAIVLLANVCKHHDAAE